MASVEYLTFVDNDSRNAAVMSSVFAAFADRSSTVHGAMFRDEGLDDRVLNRGAVVGGAPTTASGDADDDEVEYAGVPVTRNNTAAELLDLGTVTMRCNNGGAGWTLLEGESLRLRFSCSFSMVIVGDYSDRLRFEIHKTVGGVTAQPSLSAGSAHRGLRFVYPVWPGATAASPCEVDVYRDSVYLMWAFVGPIVLDSVEIQTRIDAGAYTIGRASMQVVPFYR